MKYRLFAPGPTPVSEETSLAMAHPIVHHRTSGFEKVVAEVREGLKWLFQTKNEVLILASSGTGAMEGAVVNTLSRGDKVIVVDGGKFGERWWKICKVYGVEADVVRVNWGEAVSPKEIETRLKKGGYRAVFFQASESSTGTYHPVKEIAALTREVPDCLCVVDAISALGAMDLPMDAWGIDILITGSQKALGLPPGLAMVSLSDKAWKATDRATLPRFYFDFKRERKNSEANTTAFTPAISLVLGLQAVLRKIKEEGLKAIFSRHARLAEATRAAMKAIGLTLYSKSPVNSLTAVCTPEGMDAQKVFKTLQTKYNLTIAGGQDQAKGKIFRIAHLGFFDDLDIVTVVGAVEMVLAELGHKFELGRGVGAALKILSR